MYKNNETELCPRYDARASFYGKSRVYQDDDETALISYTTKVVSIDKNRNVTLLSAWDCSPTTMRHVCEFLKQYSTLNSCDKAKDVRKRIANGEYVEK